LLPVEIIQAFKREFNKPEYKDITLPEEANGLEKIVVYDSTSFLSPPNPVYKQPAELKIREVVSPSARELLDTSSESASVSQP
jgi:hypothetical protein